MGPDVAYQTVHQDTVSTKRRERSACRDRRQRRQRNLSGTGAASPSRLPGVASPPGGSLGASAQELRRQSTGDATRGAQVESPRLGALPETSPDTRT